ncbi:hypothetical protein B0H16DRAFT_1414858 [Mycena metata]|uniref:Nephrocystin 3-like N-terminal domain-containing protein n=1 Tax=Mycena metata TaxID=1033252 RepID=A0AAD7NIE9_9AGAR|nr:hypothetical protein B0H16DRAFT_1414844 [Mycena metata]KAJ7761777.1 hypothetical protein B0H16DRAFT_1414858 [Mycena metata]
MTQFNVTSHGESGIDILYRSVVIEALHDSGERSPEPACHPGTRTKVLEMLRAWSIDRSRESTILWLYGAAGMGKSAIAQMFAGNCAAHGRLGASFFFRRGHPKRGTWDGLFTTLAYQLANSVSELLSPIQQAVEADKLIVGRAMTAQFQKLLLRPFLNTSSLRFIPILVLDGIDECKDHEVQQQILRLFITAIRNQGLPVRLLITSRPEPHLVETLQSRDICRQSQLRDDKSAFDDIRIYLGAEFSRIYHEFRGREIDLGPRWPAPEAIGHLVEKSSGIFIYAATVIRFIGNEYTHPAERLAAVLRLDPRSTAPLDDLYTEILSVIPPEATRARLRVLHAIWQGTQHSCFTMRPEHIETLLQLPRGSARLALRALHSLFYLPPMYTSFSFPTFVRPLHASLGDYLGDQARSGRWCVSVSRLHTDFLHCVLRLLGSPPNTVDTRNFHT